MKIIINDDTEKTHKPGTQGDLSIFDCSGDIKLLDDGYYLSCCACRSHSTKFESHIYPSLEIDYYQTAPIAFLSGNLKAVVKHHNAETEFYQTAPIAFLSGNLKAVVKHHNAETEFYQTAPIAFLSGNLKAVVKHHNAETEFYQTAPIAFLSGILETKNIYHHQVGINSDFYMSNALEFISGKLNKGV